MIREEPVLYVPRNPSQQAVLNAYEEHDILFLLGPAGSGKTHAAVAPVLRDIINRKKHGVRRLVLSRPQIEAGERMGFLPGDVKEKMSPWLLPFYDVIGRMTRTKAETIFTEHVEIVPLALMRGRTFDHCAAILDEAQNCSYAQLRMFLTRIGENGKLLIVGDPEQSDLPDGYDLIDTAAALNGLVVTDSEGKEHSIGVVKFTDQDIVRHPLIGQILQRMYDAEYPPARIAS